MFLEKKLFFFVVKCIVCALLNNNCKKEALHM